MNKILAALALALVAAGCASTPPSSLIDGPMTAQPLPPGPQATPLPGAIYAADGYRPLFEDSRARNVGDILTIVISERAAVDKKSGASSSRDGSVELGIGDLLTVPFATLGRLGIEGGGSSSSTAKDNGSASSTFSSTLGVTVIERLPNGNLRVAGEKQIGLDRGAEYIRFSGVVPPTAIQAGNIVQSSRVADARLEYRTSSNIDRAALGAFLNRFFFSLLLI